MLRRRRPRGTSRFGAVAAVVLTFGAMVVEVGDSAVSVAATDLSAVEGGAHASRQAVRLRRSGGMRLPVGGLPDGSPGRCTVLDNFGDPRGTGRTHEGLDIMASLGQEVFAVADGVLVRLDPLESPRSGLAWALLADTGAYFYYAHLSAIAAGLAVGARVRDGQVIGYVGDSGNAGPGNTHLHFEVRPGGQGTPAVDPMPLLDVPVICRIVV